MPNEKCPDCGRTDGHEAGCFQTGGDPEAIRCLVEGPLGKRCGLWAGPDGTSVEAEVARAARR